jgi:HSP20 family protein
MKIYNKEAIFMNLTLFKPKSTLSPLFDNLDFFNDLFFTENKTEKSVPDVNIFETENSYEIEIDTPGVKKENLNVEIKDNILTISGKRLINNRKNNEKEKFYESFSRSFKIKDIEEENIKANYENGVLFLSLFKNKTKNYKKIEVN